MQNKQTNSRGNNTKQIVKQIQCTKIRADTNTKHVEHGNGSATLYVIHGTFKEHIISYKVISLVENI